MPIRTAVKEIAAIRMADMTRRPRAVTKAISKHGRMVLLLSNGQWWWDGSTAYEFNDCYFIVESSNSRYFSLLMALVDLGVISKASLDAFRVEVKREIERDRHREILWCLRLAYRRYGLTLKRDTKFRAYEKLIDEKVYHN